MTRIGMIERDNIPWWYQLGWQPSPSGIILRVRNNIIDQLYVFDGSNRLVKILLDKCGFTNFDGSLAGNFGFNQAFQYVGTNDEFREWIIPIPTIERLAGIPCQFCNGTGKRPREFQANTPCLVCQGNGKTTERDLQSARAMVASFWFFTLLTRIPEFETKSPMPQLMILSVTFGFENNRVFYGIGGTFSKILRDWLATLQIEKSIPAVVKAMVTAHQTMSLGKSDRLDSRAWVSNAHGSLHLNVPGIACGIDPYQRSRYEYGYEFIHITSRKCTTIADMIRWGCETKATINGSSY